MRVRRCGPSNWAIDMKTLLRWIHRRLGSLLLLGLGLASAGPALADTYNILLKPPGSTTPATCASGSFTFSKTSAGSFSVPATVQLSGNCLGLGNGSFGTTLTVIVENVTINGQNQGPNVVGLSGLLTQATGNNPSTIAFQYSAGSASTSTPLRTTTYTDQNGNNTITTNGAYHVVNINALNVPEPSALWLVVAALGALVVVRRGRQRV